MSDPTKLSAADQAAHDLSLARAFGETPEQVAMAADAQPAERVKPQAEQHTGEVYASRYGSYNFPKPSGQ